MEAVSSPQPWNYALHLEGLILKIHSDPESRVQMGALCLA